ncbi:hypothetical protein [uncultured Paraglaciecola sp.]|uniref:hypothetical protein n=1 Tax=uncultured Paraglaciecola sp. TaxID=1765024 RepID=UPI0026284053|nr:hypothetical protein [uncultured Paraglaciecola sp.]
MPNPLERVTYATKAERHSARLKIGLSLLELVEDYIGIEDSTPLAADTKPTEWAPVYRELKASESDGHSMEEYDVKPMINRNTKSTSPHSLLALVKTEAISRHLLGILNTRESEDAVQSLYSAATLKGMYGSHYSTSKWTPKHIMEQAIEKYYHSVAQNDYAPVLLRVWMVDYLRGQMGIKPGNDESGT